MGTNMNKIILFLGVCLLICFTVGIDEMKNEEDSLSLRIARGADAKKKRRTKIRRVKKRSKSKGRLREQWKKTKRRKPKKNEKRKGPMNSRKRNMRGKKRNGRRRGKFVRNDTDCHVKIYKYMKQYG